MSGSTSTGDGMGGYDMTAPTPETDYSQMVKDLHKTMGDAKSVRPDKRTRILNEIYNLTGSKGAAGKAGCDAALTYLFIVHGASPNVGWRDIDLIVPGSSKPTPMNLVVDIIDRRQLRKFASGFSFLAIQMHDSSAELRSMLVERAVRSGVPVTETMAMIDFLDMSGENPHGAAMRVKGKYGAVQRAEVSALSGNSLEKASHRGRPDPVATYGGPAQREDSLGPM